MTNTTPLNEEDRLGEILTAVFNEGMAYQVSSLKDYKDLNFMSVKTAKQELTNLIQTLEKKAYDKGYSDCVDSLGRPVNIPNTQLEKGSE